MAYTLLEGAVVDTREFFEADVGGGLTKFNQRLQTIRTQLGLTDVQLPVPAGLTYSDPEGLRVASAIALTNRLCFVGDGTNFDLWKFNTVQATHGVTIWYISRAQVDAELRQLILYRYGQAIFETLVDAHMDTSYPWEMIGTSRFEVTQIPETDERAPNTFGQVRFDFNLTAVETR